MPHEISTEPLAQMLRSITFQKRTGLLRVEQFEEKGREQGEIYFEGGRPIRARAGQDTGKAAFKRISDWKHITCAFDSLSRPYPGNVPALAAPQEQRAESEPLVRQLHSSLPQTETLPRTPLPVSSKSISKETGPQRVSGVVPPSSQIPSPSGPVPSVNLGSSIVQKPVTQALSSHGNFVQKVPEASQLPGASRPNQRWITRPIGQESSPSSIPSGKPLVAPRLEPLPVGGPLPGRLAIFKARSMIPPSQALRQMERYDRIIFILLDGSRTVEDIARLTHYSESEVEQVLVRLGRLGYVERFTGPRPTSTVHEKMVHLFTSSRQDEQVSPSIYLDS